MTEKELKKLNRYQLLELLIMQTARADQLEQQLEEVQNKLNAREIELESVGSIAEASVKISGLMEAAQETVEMYIAASNKRIEKMEKAASRRADKIIADARREAAEILEKAGKPNSEFAIWDLDNEQ